MDLCPLGNLRFGSAQRLEADGINLVGSGPPECMKLKEYQERAPKEVNNFLEQLTVWRPQAVKDGTWLFDFAEKAREESKVPQAQGRIEEARGIWREGAGLTHRPAGTAPTPGRRRGP